MTKLPCHVFAPPQPLCCEQQRHGISGSRVDRRVVSSSSRVMLCADLSEYMYFWHREFENAWAMNMQSFTTPETVPRQLAKEKEILSTSHISPKEHFKRSLRQVPDAANFGLIKKILYSCILQLDLSEDCPEVLCEKKLVFAPPNLQERIAALAWQVLFGYFVFNFTQSHNASST